jgi:hypothetical protein
METRCPLAKQNVKFKKLNKKKGRGNQEEHEKQVIYMNMNTVNSKVNRMFSNILFINAADIYTRVSC